MESLNDDGDCGGVLSGCNEDWRQLFSVTAARPDWQSPARDLLSEQVQAEFLGSRKAVGVNVHVQECYGT